MTTGSGGQRLHGDCCSRTSHWRADREIGCFSSLPSLSQLQRSDIHFSLPESDQSGFLQWKVDFFLIGKKLASVALSACTLTRPSSEELRLRSLSFFRSGCTRPSTRQTHARAHVFVSSVEDGHVGPQKDVSEDPEGSYRLRDVQGLEAQQAEANTALKNLQGDNTEEIGCPLCTQKRTRSVASWAWCHHPVI